MKSEPISREMFRKLCPDCKKPDDYTHWLNECLVRYQITSPLCVAAVMGQCMHESSRFTRFEENLNYKWQVLMMKWPRHFTEAAAKRYGRIDGPNKTVIQKANPAMIANIAYENRMGNGPRASGDGYAYRGRGVIQLTGKTAYARFAHFACEPDLLQTPDRVAAEPELAVLSAVWFWSINELNRFCVGSIKHAALTKAINGSSDPTQNHLAERVKYSEYALSLIQSAR